MNDKLSSPFTILYKFVEPAFGAFLLGTIALGWFPANGLPAGARIIFILAGLVGLGFGVRLAISLKTVELDGNLLRVSDYFREETIPLQSIGEIEEMRFLGPKRIKLTLLAPCGFGDTIVFLPAARFHFPLTGHPIVEELRQKIAAETGAPVA